MDWALAIRRNRAALERILAALFALVRLADGPQPEMSEEGQDPWLGPKAASEPRRVPRSLHAHALRIMRAAESAIRRLIVIAARDVVARPRPGSAPVLSPEPVEGSKGAGGGMAHPAALRIPAFPLLDPLKRHSFDPPRRASSFMPRICLVGVTEPAPIPERPVVSPDDPVDASGLCRRLLSSRRALANLPREARRLARWYQRNRLSRGPGRVSPLRFGRPPGSRKRPLHVVDGVLKECQALALDVLDPPNTS